MNYRNRDLACIPIHNILRCFNLTNRKSCFYSRKVMLKPISNKHRFSVCTFNQILQCIQFPVVNWPCSFFFIVDAAISHLQKFPGKNCSIGSIYLFLPNLGHHIFTKGFIDLNFLRIHKNRNFIHYTFRKCQIITGLHTDCDVRYSFINQFFRTRRRFVSKNTFTISLVRKKERIAVVSNVPAKSFSKIKNTKVRP